MTHTYVTHKSFLPSFGFPTLDQTPVCICTVLSINDTYGDCAAYRGVTPADGDYTSRVAERGDKISAEEARSLFYIIEARALRYRS